MTNLFIVIFSWVLIFALDFAVLYFFGTKDLALCGSISFITANISAFVISTKKDTLQIQLPLYEEIDGHINRLFDICKEYEEKIQELSEKINQLENEISELTDKFE
jgi:peptidoglycan hydrolase CwlO-like protein